MPEFTWIKTYADYILAVGIFIGAAGAIWKWVWPVVADWFVQKPAVELKRLAFEAEWMKEHSEVPMFRLNANLECVWANSALHTLLKANDDQLEGTNWLKIIHRDDRENVKAQWRAAVADKCPYQNTQRMLTGGQYRIFEVVGDPFIHSGRVIEFMGIVREIGWLE